MYKLCCIVFLYHFVKSVPVVNRLIEDQYVSKHKDLDFEIPSDLFRANDDESSTIYLTSTTESHIFQKYHNANFASHYPTIQARKVYALDHYFYVIDVVFGVRIFDISDRSKIEIVGEVEVKKPRNIHVYGDYVYVVTEDSEEELSGLIIIDVHDKSDPQVESTWKPSPFSSIESVICDGNFVYLTETDANNIQIIDVTNKNNPFLVSTTTPYSEPVWDAFDIALSEDYIYVPDSSGSELKVFRRNSTEPKFLGNSEALGSVYALHLVSDSLAYLTAGTYGIKIINVSTPTPIVISSLSFGSLHINGVASASRNGYGDIVYAVGDQDGTDFGYIVNATNKTHPYVVNTFPTYASDHIDVFAHEDSLLFVASKLFGIQIYDISQNLIEPKVIYPRHIIHYGRVSRDNVTAGSGANTLVRMSPSDDFMVYMLARYNRLTEKGLFAFDISKVENGGQPLFAGGLAYSSDEELDIKDFVVDDGYVYLIDWGAFPPKFRILQRLEESPTVEGSRRVRFVELSKTVFMVSQRVFVEGDLAYVTVNFDGSGLRVLNISDRSNPLPLHDIDTGGSVHIFVKGEIAYLSHGVELMQMGIMNITSQSFLSTLDMGEEITDIQVMTSYDFVQEREKTYAYVACDADGLKIVDVTNPQDPKILSYVDGEEVLSVSVNGDFAYVADKGSGEVLIVDVSDKTSPQVVERYTESLGMPYSVVARKNYFFVSDMQNGIEAVRMDLKLEGNPANFAYFCGESSVTVTSTDVSGEMTTGFQVLREDYCNGHGKCLPSLSCSCDFRFYGDNCESWKCQAIDFREIGKVCSGNGDCTSHDECQCRGGYSGERCQTNDLYLSVMTPLLSVGMIGFVGLLCCSCLVLCCFCCILFVGIFFCISGLMVVVIRQFKGLKNFGRLQDFDLLLREQQHELDASVAHFRINKSLFEIPFDEIQTESILGEGGSNSIVFKARWNNLTVAFKCFKTRTVMLSQAKFDEFEREVEILGSLHHPNIIRFFGATMKHPRIGIVMEYVSNGEILEYILKFREKSGSAYPLFQKLRMLYQVAVAMAFLHKRSIIHRDLKSENVLIDATENCKLMDFGLSRLVDRMSTNKTMRIGTGVYMAPEVIMDSNYNEKCDVFSFAIFTYIVLTELENPYGGTNFQIEMKVANDPTFRPSLEKLEFIKSGGNQHEWITKMIVNSWDHDPSKREGFEGISKSLENGYKKLAGESTLVGEGGENAMEKVMDGESGGGLREKEIKGYKKYESMTKRELIRLLLEKEGETF